MKKINELWQRVSSYVRRNPTEIIFGAYFLFVMLVSAYAASSTTIFSKNFIAILVLYAVFSLVPKIHRGIEKISFEPWLSISKKEKVFCFFVTSGIAFIVLFICFLGNYPGVYGPDSFIQYQQSVSGSYSDWHPVWHTLMIFTFPLKLTGGWIGSIVFFQIIYFSILIGYMAVTIYKYAGPRYTFISIAFILLSPLTHRIIMYPWKDVAFAIASGFCMLYAINIYFTNGEWGNKFYKMVLLAFMLASATLFRHNGILFTFFLLIALIFYMPKRKWFLLVCMVGLILILIKVPLYSFFYVQKAPYRVMETMGLPLSVIVNVTKECPDRVNAQTADFVSEMMQDQPDWKEFHNISGFNTIKFRGVKFDTIENEGITQILKMCFHCFVAAPKQSIMAIYGLTASVYSFEYAAVFRVGVRENDFGITYSGITSIQKVENYYKSLIEKTPLRFIFLCVGFSILVMVAFILFKSDFKRIEDWKRLLLCFPIFAYNFGTMLFLSGNSDVRFFYVSFIICPLVVLIMCGKRESDDGI